MGEAFKKPYIYLMLLIFLIYIILNLFISGFYETVILIVRYSEAVNWVKLSLSIALSLVIAILIAINTTYLYINYKQKKICKKEATTTSMATIGGLITGFCPLCITGLFPVIFGIFGISLSLASLPFQGIEVQFFIAVILVISYGMLVRR